jgi:Protein of unknown function (DUF 659)/hAT family C-terminal dimerisation region
VVQSSKKNQLAQCVYCDKQFWVGSGSRIRAHLGVESIDGVMKCDKVPEDVAARFVKAEMKNLHGDEAVARKRAFHASFSSTSTSTAIHCTDAKQLTITAICDKRSKSEVDEAVARMCYSTGVSFSVVNNKHFKEMCRKIGQYGPSYRVPTDYPIRTTLLEREYRTVSRRVDEFHADFLSRTGGSIVSDGWSDAQRRPLLNVLLVTPAGGTFLNSVDSSGETKDAPYIAQIISQAIEKVGPDKVVQVVTDNAANCKAAWPIISEKYSHIVCSPCAAHCLDLLLEDWGKLFIASVVRDAVDIVQFINGHDGSRALMLKHSPGKGLLRPASTRFGTNVIMLQRLLELKANLQEMVASRSYKDWVKTKYYQNLSNPITQLVTSEDFWAKCQMYVDFNMPVYELLRLIDGRSPVIGKVYYRMFQIQEKIKGFVGITPSQRQQLYQPFVDRWAMLHTDLHSAGFLLDPEYIGMAQHTNEEVMNGFYQLVEKLFPASEEQVLISSQLSQFRSGHGLFGRPVAKAAASSLSAYQWWLNFGASVPELQTFAVKVLSQTTSSSEAERNWSLFGFVQSKRRCSLKCETLDKMVYIHANTRLIDNINEVDYKEQNVDWQLPDNDASDSDGESSKDTDVDSSS